MKPTRSPGRLILVVAALVLGHAATASSLELEVGLNFTGCGEFECGGWYPPDTMGAVGDEHIVHVVNGQFRVFRKGDGAMIRDMPLDEFWFHAGVLGAYSFDPRVVYDPFSRRWFVVSADFDSIGFLFAVSRTEDPTQGWTGFKIAGEPTGQFVVDFPTIGFNADAVVLAATLCTLEFTGCLAQVVVVLPKDDLLAATSSIENGTVFPVPQDLAYHTQPTVDLDGAGLPASLFAASPRGFAQHARVLGPVDMPELLTDSTTFFLPAENTAPNAKQPVLFPIETWRQGGVLTNPVLRNGALWSVQVVGRDGRAAIRWVQIDRDTNAVLQAGVIADAIRDFYFPSIAVNESDQVVIGFNGSSRSQFVSSYAVAGQVRGGGAVFGEPVLLKEGVGPQIHIDQFDRNRWGDYSATVVDPTDPLVFWTFQAWADLDNQWSTQITQLTVIPEVIEIDIEPDRDPNILGKTKGNVPVAILGSEAFDVAAVGVATLAFGPAGASQKHELSKPQTRARHYRDVNGDGFIDLLLHYRLRETGIDPGDPEACLRGATLDGTAFEACDSVVFD